jgi:hypothetical protein
MRRFPPCGKRSAPVADSPFRGGPHSTRDRESPRSPHSVSTTVSARMARGISHSPRAFRRYSGTLVPIRTPGESKVFGRFGLPPCVARLDLTSHGILSCPVSRPSCDRIALGRQEVIQVVRSDFPERRGSMGARQLWHFVDGPEGIRTLDLSVSLGRPNGARDKSRSLYLAKLQARARAY